MSVTSLSRSEHIAHRVRIHLPELRIRFPSPLFCFLPLLMHQEFHPCTILGLGHLATQYFLRSWFKNPKVSMGGCTGSMMNLVPNVFLSWETWKVGCIRVDGGRSSWYATAPIFCKILKGPKYHGDGLRLRWWATKIYQYDWSRRYIQSPISNTCSFLLKYIYLFILSCALCRLWRKICSIFREIWGYFS